MGRDSRQINSSVMSLRNIELDRLVVKETDIGKKNKASNLIGEEEEDNLDAILNHACGPLNENVYEEGLDIFSVI